MGRSAAYGDQFDKVFRAVRTNLATILTSNGFSTDVVLVHERDDPLRPEDITGAILKITDFSEDFTYRTAGEVTSDLIYNVEGWLPKQTSATLRANLRAFISDFLKAHHDDVSLVAADLANGGSGQRLVGEHRIIRIERQYAVPNGYFKADVRCRICFNTSA